MDIKEKIQEELFALQDQNYRDFHASLLPTVDKETIIGIRTPKLRAFAKQFGKTEESREFLQMLPHDYYEENNLHGLLLMQIKDYGELLKALEDFLPWIDNWASCDLLAFSMIKKNREEFIKEIPGWIHSQQPYIVRFGISMLMKYYLDEGYKEEYPAWVAGISSEEYYVNMMRAWYFATALAKQYEKILPYLQERRLDKWTHNKTIQKAVESYRITAQQKEYLKTLRIKK